MYPYPVQRSIGVATMTMYNFIRKELIADILFLRYENEDITLEANHNNDSSTSSVDEAVDIGEQMEMS